jgi:hypothetical protein
MVADLEARGYPRRRETMSVKSKAGKAQWQGRQGSYADELAEGITRRASARMGTWAARGRIPLLIRAKAFVRGRVIGLPAKDERR